MNIQYICKHCGSSEVVFDAYAQWNPESQDFEIYNTFDDSWCQECEGANTVKTIEYVAIKQGEQS
jgi:hypothetical protein